jgi:predicted pyridoxine 5'-phosphate oxidase superfamily flavin-nucleotide-binding protein
MVRKAVTKACRWHLNGMESPFHSGELEMQRGAGVEDEARAVGRIIAPRIAPGAARFLGGQRLAVAAGSDERGRMWASLLSGPPGFVSAVDDTLLVVRPGRDLTEPFTHAVDSRPDLGLLVLDPRTRQRYRFNGRAMVVDGDLFLHVNQAYGNCPKYIQSRESLPDGDTGQEAALPSRELGSRQQSWIRQADTFFLASAHPRAGADASHRGGFPGFVRVLDPGRLAFSDYAGNNMFNTLGNLVANPAVGLLFVDFTTGATLQITGRATVRADREVTVEIDEVRETPRATALRYRLLEYSPANPSLSQAAAGGISST